MTPLERAQADVEALKIRENNRTLARTDDLGLGPDWAVIGTVDLGKWDDWDEAQRLAALKDLVDWDGVSAADKRSILAHEVDFRLVAPQDQQLILGEVWHHNDAKPVGRVPADTDEMAPESPPDDRTVRPLTQQLIDCCYLDAWPSNATVIDFGIDSDRHLGALQYAFREGLVTPQELDAAVGNGEQLTEFAKRGENPYKDVTFHTSWDDMRIRGAMDAEQGKYQVWQAKDVTAARAGWSAFPDDYHRTIEVSAQSVKEAYEATNGGCWWESMEVEVVADGVRSTTVGDVIVDPDGKAYRVHSDDFRAIDPWKERPARDEPPLERVERQLREWKVNHSPEFVPDPATGRIGPGTYRPEEDAWRSLSDAGKLSVLETVVDWTGVSDRNKQAILTREVDFARITRDELHAVYEDVISNHGLEVDERPGRRLFDEANFAQAVGNADAMPFAEQLAAVRDTTRDLVHSVLADSWPRAGAMVDFGLDSQEHYEALYHPIRNQELSPSVLDAAMGYGEKLTELARNADSNPHNDVRFHTSWDVLLGRQAEPDENTRPPEYGDYDRKLEEAAERGSGRAQDKGKDGPERQERIVDDDKLYDWAAKAAAEVVNLHLHADACMRFQAVLGVFLNAIKLAAAEQREILLTPSKN